MIAIEEQLRGDLQLAANTVEDELDVDALLATGRRRRTARTARRLAGVAALAVVASLVSWAGLGGHLTGDVPVLATPRPATPSASASVGSEDTVVFGDGTDVPEGAGATRIAASATVTGTGYEVEFTVTRPDGTTVTEHRVNNGRELTWAQLGPRLVVTFLPHRYDWISFRRPSVDDFNGVSFDQRTYNDLDATAGYLVADADGEFPGVDGYLWRWQGGPMYNQLGEVAPTLTLTLHRTGRTAVIYSDRSLDVVGITEDGHFGERVDQPKAVQTLAGWSSEANGLAVGAVVLPTGASDAVVTSAGEGLETASGTLDGRLVVLAAARMPKAEQRVFSSLTYTDVDGGRVTKRFD